ncbi:polysaccharide pyruvyl transferase family protein [Sphingobium sp. Sx8-8]|uniref:polysaccharide pyruvyl transferase family protein n=1 Tax=Sphingobium sp. Sx8-8 TaxID=2933617 RepID=UPI001F5667FC|nr:polysaccharide pyruvyl transferase family protein [Sphingobium sp. Sx8-8]
MWIDDPYWVRAAKFILNLPTQVRYVLAPAEMNHLRDGCLPPAFGHILSPENCIIVIPKDDVDQLPKAWIEVLPTWEVIYADEVFVAIRAGILTSGPRNDDHHLQYMYDRCEKILDGIQVRAHRIDEELSDDFRGKPYVLIAAASLIGNAGDRLLAAAAVRLLKLTCPELSIVVSDGSPDRTLVREASAVIIGPGGMLYDIENATRLDLNNLANWFGIGYVSSEYKSNLYLIGLGHQNINSSIGRIFAKESVKYARMASARDRETSKMLLEWMSNPVQYLPDMSVIFSEDILKIAEEVGGNRTISLCGDFCNISGISEMASWMRKHGGVRLRYIVQANEDAESLRIHRDSIIEMLGTDFEEIDCRTSNPMEFCRAVATSDALITTRFHGMMVALMSGVDLLTFTVRGDKRERMRNELGAHPWARFEPVVTDLRHVKKTIISLITDGRRDSKRAVSFDRAPFIELGKRLGEDLRQRI